MVIDAILTYQYKPNYCIESEEVKIFWKFITRYHSSKWCCMFAISIFRGSRIGEIVAINLTDFLTEDYGLLNMILQKSYIQDDFPLIKELADYIAKYIKENKHTFKDGYLFPFYSKKKAGHSHMDSQTADSWFCKVRKEIAKGRKLKNGTYDFEPHPEFLDKRRVPKKQYLILKFLNDKVPINQIVKALRMSKDSYYKITSRLVEEGYMGYNGLTEKGCNYIKEPKYSWKYRICWHSCRRWFTDELDRHGVDWKDIAKFQRYLKETTVFTYLNSRKTLRKEKDILQNILGEMARDIMNIDKGQNLLTEFAEFRK